MTPEDVNRARVAEHLADILWDAGATTGDDIANLDGFVWNLAVGALAQQQVDRHLNWELGGRLGPEPWQPKPGYVPSDQTRVAVAGLIAYRSRHVPAEGYDPFDGLPGVER